MSSINKKITVILPARAGSERVIHKNTRPFADFEGGLLELKLKQLSAVEEVNRIIVSSNDLDIIEYANNFSSKIDSRVVAIERPNELGLSSTPMSAFIRYAATLEQDGVMLMTHVTHPFVTSKVFSDLIEAWCAAEEKGYDSLVTVTTLHKFIWDENGPYNYDDTIEKWPRSQDIKPLFEINHAAYIIPFMRMREVDDRVGTNVYLYSLAENISMDIDWEDQFQLLNDIALAKRYRGISLI